MDMILIHEFNSAKKILFVVHNIYIVSNQPLKIYWLLANQILS